MKTKKVNTEVTLNWFNKGKGYGGCTDAEGKHYVLHGCQIGGDDWGQNADEKLTVVGEKYQVTSVWLADQTQSFRVGFYKDTDYVIKTMKGK